MKITHDFHLHTNLSPCADRDITVYDYLDNAKRIGLTKIGVCDHFWDSAIDGANKFYKSQTYEHISQNKDELRSLGVYFGCECEYDPFHHGIAMRPELAERFDYILVPNSHTHMMMPKNLYEPYEKHAEFMVNAFREIISCPVSKHITAIAHPFGAVKCPYPNTVLIDLIPDDTFKRLFSEAAERKIGFEINVLWMSKKTEDEIANASQMRMYRIAKECGMKFIFGSDSHKKSTQDTYKNADFCASLLGLAETDIIEIAR